MNNNILVQVGGWILPVRMNCVDTQFGIILVNGIILVVGKFFWYFVSVVVDAR